jgi:short-subunit dehydrogenase
MGEHASVRPKKIIILGALSAIAEATARLWASKGAHLMLAARDAERLKAVAADLQLRGAVIETIPVDLASVDAERTFAEMTGRLGGIDTVLLAYGVLGDQDRAERKLADAQDILRTDFTSAANWCLVAANELERQGHGSLVVIGSVAGDRGRASNYVYGAAKGGLSILVQGIAHRLASKGARAVVVKPGLVDTPMTAHIGEKERLWAKPEAIARIIVAVADPERRAPLPVVYAPWYWRWIMYVVRFIPSSVFHRTRL